MASAPVDVSCSSTPAASSSEPPLTPPISESTVPSSSPKSIFKPPESSRESIVSSSQLTSPLVVSPAKSVDTTDPRNALFDDHVASSHVPGSLHLAPDSTIQRLVEKQGYITVIRQLAEDLAHRDRELVTFRRRAEERERALRKMLLEVEVSNADIEKRLVSATLQRKPSKDTMRSGDGMSYTESIDEMMHQALTEEDAFSLADDASGVLDYGEGDLDLTPRQTVRRETDTVSINSNASKRSSRGWKGLFAGRGPVDGEAVKARRAAAALSTVKKRSSISPKTFSPPPEGEASRALHRQSSRASLSSVRSTSGGLLQQSRIPSTASIYTQHHFASPADKSSSSSVKKTPENVDSQQKQNRSNSVAHWALQVVSSSNSTSDDTEAPRSPVVDSHPPVEPPRKSSLGITDIQRTKARTAAAAHARNRAPSAATTAAGSLKTSFFQEIRDTAAGIVPLSQSTASKKSDDAGPVEMDMIIPPEAQPPTLLQGWNMQYPNTGSYLTDRFGFIYNKQQRSVSIKGQNSIEGSYTERKQSEAHGGTGATGLGVGNIKPPPTASLVDDITGTSPKSMAVLPEGQEWKETIYGPTLLANVSIPSASSSSSSFPIDKPPAPAPAAFPTRLSLPSLTTPPITALPAPPPASAEESTVRLLLSQMSDLHDALQRDRQLKWNEFLRKVSLERRKVDTKGAGMPETLMNSGEVIGISTLGTEGRGGKQRWKEFKSLVLGGIPVTYRWKIWTECSGATSMKVPGYYEDLLANGQDDPEVLAQIGMDINRTLTDNIFFRQGPGVVKLRQVLVAYSRRNKEVGYCQGMNMIAASLLLIMPSEEDAFWVLCSVVERILPKTYFEPSLLASRADQEVLKHFVFHLLPSLHHHLASLCVTLEALCFQWFLSIFTDTLAAEALFRVWDVILCTSGSPFLFQVAIALLKLNEKELLACKTAAEVYSYLNGGMIHQGISIDGLIREAERLGERIGRTEVEVLRERAVERELERERGGDEREEREEREERSGEGEQQHSMKATEATEATEVTETTETAETTDATKATETLETNPPDDQISQLSELDSSPSTIEPRGMEEVEEEDVTTTPTVTGY
ncbi:rab-GTPase-TBC domain-containing protein [Pyronema omphalodes]|nr:rab-GTPase-TBC domain-containing protein [Pyronema omphalodes]